MMWHALMDGYNLAHSKFGLFFSLGCDQMYSTTIIKWLKVSILSDKSGSREKVILGDKC